VNLSQRLAVALLSWLFLSATALLAQPRLILVVSIDQMRYDYLTRFAPVYQGGFKTLLDRGAVFTNSLYRHANTETAPGHAVILSGQHPSHSGIVANLWYDPLLKRSFNVVDDPAHLPVGGPGRGASPANFLGASVGDKIRQKWPDSRVVAVAVKDRSAVLLAGRRATAAYWFEEGCGCFITSTYYAAQPPAWLVEFNKRKLPDSYFQTPWTRLLPDSAVYEKYATADDSPGEWDLKDTTFPHAHRGRPPARAYYENLRRTPFSDEMALEAALGALQAHGLGAGPAPDLFIVSFSAADTIGHTYGSHSQEVMDTYLRLDRLLDRLLKAVEARAGSGRALTILTSDHGALPLPEWLQRQGIDGQRRTGRSLLDAVQAAFRKRYPSAPDLVALYEAPFFWLNLETMARLGLRRAEVEQTAIRALLDTGSIAAVYTHAGLLSDAPSRDPYLGLFRNSFFEPRSPHLIPLPKKNYYIDDFIGGSGHGTPYEYDRHVPLIWMGPGIKPGRHAALSGPEDIAPTLARLLGIDYPLEPDARLLTEILP